MVEQLTQFDDAGHGGVPAAFGARRHRQVVNVSWRQREAGPHHVTSHLRITKIHTHTQLLFWYTSFQHSLNWSDRLVEANE